jgi:hypothetical protein
LSRTVPLKVTPCAKATRLNPKERIKVIIFFIR